MELKNIFKQKNNEMITDKYKISLLEFKLNLFNELKYENCYISKNIEDKNKDRKEIDNLKETLNNINEETNLRNFVELLLPQFKRKYERNNFYSSSTNDYINKKEEEKELFIKENLYNIIFKARFEKCLKQKEKYLILEEPPFNYYYNIKDLLEEDKLFKIFNFEVDNLNNLFKEKFQYNKKIFLKDSIIEHLGIENTFALFDELPKLKELINIDQYTKITLDDYTSFLSNIIKKIKYIDRINLDNQEFIKLVASLDCNHSQYFSSETLEKIQNKLKKEEVIEYNLYDDDFEFEEDNVIENVEQFFNPLDEPNDKLNENNSSFFDEDYDLFNNKEIKEDNNENCVEKINNVVEGVKDNECVVDILSIEINKQRFINNIEEQIQLYINNLNQIQKLGKEDEVKNFFDLDFKTNILQLKNNNMQILFLLEKEFFKFKETLI
jgi:hypothetical protein